MQVRCRHCGGAGRIQVGDQGTCGGPLWADCSKCGVSGWETIPAGKVYTTCDRCKKEVEGELSEEFTAGFYLIQEDGHGWGTFTNPGECVICDSCMLADARYIKAYGHRKPDAQVGHTRPI